MKTTRFSIGGYNFDDWSLVKELYVPTDVTSSIDRSLHMRGREGLEHHLQHYVIPYGKVFIAFALTNVKMSTTSSIGLFGTGKAYGRYPESHQQPGDLNEGAPFAWAVDHGQYWREEAFGTLVIHGGIIYECNLTHDSAADKEPPNATYWLVGSEWSVDWVSGKFYFFNELEMVTVEGVAGAYMSTVDHTSSSDNKPCDNNWASYWNPGDEFTPDLTSQFGFSEQVLNVSEGTKNPFSKDIIAVFERFAENRLRRIDAMTSGGTLDAGATLHGIEVDA